MSLIKIDCDKLSLRAQSAIDQDFLLQLYASTRQAELSSLAWPQAQLDAFLQQQFQAQNTQYLASYPDALFQIIEYEGEAIGRLYVAHLQEEVRLIDIALLPEYQNLGMGEHLIKGVLDDARTASIPERIHVEQLNPAQRLYKRLGFQIREQRGVHLFMEYN